MTAYYSAAFGFVLNALLWGFGVGILAMPRPWKRYWPVLAAPAGLALQSLVVWIAAYANLRGTDSYALWSELIPVAIAIGAVRVRRIAVLRADVMRFAWIGAAMAACLLALVTPLALGAGFLTTASLGGCDAGDYAAGARTLMEFARGERGGFLGLSEVVTVMSVDNFYDFWLRLNHFTPSALIALNGSVLGFEPHELTGVTATGILALSLPVVFWISRAALRHSPRASVLLTLLYGFSPVTWYAVYHVAIGQLLAALAVAILTWSGIALWNAGSPVAAARRHFVLLGIGYALVLGGYNFIIVVCLAPAGAYALGSAIQEARWAGLGRWIVAMLAPLVVTGILFFERVAGLAERFRLFRAYDFGWRVPELTPEGWMGIVAGTDLSGFAIWIRLVAGAALVAAFCLALFRTSKTQRFAGPFPILSMLVPVISGYAYLEIRGRMLDTNASYDAYKLLSVFYPGLLAAAGSWLVLARDSNPRFRRLAGVLAGLACLGCAQAAVRFGSTMTRPPLLVDKDLVALKGLEERSDVASVNVLIPDMWSRLWANTFLLKKPQYFAIHTYEGRRVTPRRGAWDLDSSFVSVRSADASTIRLGAYSLTDTRSSALRVKPGSGWHEPEIDRKTGRRWRWTDAGPSIINVENPDRHPVKTTWHFRSVGSLGDRRIIFSADGKEIYSAAVSKAQRDVDFDLTVPAAGVTLSISGEGVVEQPVRGETRALGFQVFGVDVEIQR